MLRDLDYLYSSFVMRIFNTEDGSSLKFIIWHTLLWLKFMYAMLWLVSAINSLAEINNNNVGVLPVWQSLFSLCLYCNVSDTATHFIRKHKIISHFIRKHFIVLLLKWRLICNLNCKGGRGGGMEREGRGGGGGVREREREGGRETDSQTDKSV